jgi:hypothetical protein
MDRLIQERDALADPTHSGPAPAFHRWVEAEQLPALARLAHYRPQFDAHLAERHRTLALLEQQHERGRLDLVPDAEAVRDEITTLTGWMEAG